MLLRHPAPAAAGGHDLDEVQRAAVAHRGPVLRVLGAPGTGKTTTAVEVVAARVAAGEARPDQCLLLTASRVAAATLRDRVTARVGGTSTEPLARSHTSLGFGILRQHAALAGEPAPRLLSGPEQDVVLRELLAGHAAGTVHAPDWPARVQGALGTRGFRGELRDLLMRAVEHGVDPDRLARLGRELGRPEWVAGARVLAEYDEVTALSAPGGYDPAWVLTAAADLLEDDPDARDRVRGDLRLVVVDDAQEMTPAAARLVRALAGPGTDLVLLGDPDAAVQTFRGADPRLLAGWVGEEGTLVLPTSHRLPEAVLGAAQRVTPKIGVLAGGRHRAAAPRGPGGRVETHLLRAVSQEAAYVTAELRRAHLLGGVPWSQMAVVVRGRGRTSTLRRALSAAGVPVASGGSDLPVRDEVAVRPLLALLGTVLALATGAVQAVPAEVATDVLQSPIGGADAVTLRRLRRALRRDELEGGGVRGSDELLGEVLLAPDRLAGLGPESLPARRVARMVVAGLGAARLRPEGERRAGASPWAPGVTAETVLWAMWDASGLAADWRAAALAGGAAGARADRDLDAVVALVDAAARFVDRLPQLGPDAFLEHVTGQDVPGDTLVARSPAGESVTLVTPQSAAGREWRLVVVAGVQEGVWPDLRLRGSLLGSEQLVDVVTGRERSFRAAQAAVRYDETRLFLVALTRASERVIVTAVRTDDEQPSVYLDVVDPPGEDADETLRPFSEVSLPPTLPGAVAALRRRLLRAVAGPGSPEDADGAGDRDGAGDHHGAAGAARGLARLARAGVPGADPATWWPLRRVSDHRPLRPADAPVRVSPSRVESFGQCELRWLLTTRGGEGPSKGANDIGTLVHDVAADAGDDAGAQALRAEVDVRWPRLGLRPGWLTERKRSEAHAMVDRLARYVGEAAAAGWVRVGAEVPMEVPLGRALLAGRVDRLERDDRGRLRVVDHKTGSSKPRGADLAEHPQLGAYQVAVALGGFAEHGREPGGAALLQLGKAANKTTTLQPQAPLPEHADPSWAADLLERTAAGMGGDTFVATDGDWCRTCPVRACCPLQPEGGTLG